MSISGKNSIDWPGFRAALGDIPVTHQPPLVKRKSRDFYWYSPVLKGKLDKCYGDLLVRPRNQEDLVKVLALAFAWKLPVTLRGGGTGNYGKCAPLNAGITAYFAKLQDRLGTGRHLLLALIAREDLTAFETLVVAAAAGLPLVFEFAFNHTTLEVLKVDKGVTCLQVLVPAPIDEDKVEALKEIFEDEVMMHHEFVKLEGKLVAFDLPVLRYTSEERHYEIIGIYEENGFPVSDPHSCIIEDGGMKRADYRHLATKKRFDPASLLNSSKSREWAQVKDMNADAIAALHKPGPGKKAMIPWVDISSLFGPASAEREACDRAIAEAAADTGFLCLTKFVEQRGIGAFRKPRRGAPPEDRT